MMSDAAFLATIPPGVYLYPHKCPKCGELTGHPHHIVETQSVSTGARLLTSITRCDPCNHEWPEGSESPR